jgi:hypothetical protein
VFCRLAEVKVRSAGRTNPNWIWANFKSEGEFTAGRGDDESKGQGDRPTAAEWEKPEAIAAAVTVAMAGNTLIEPAGPPARESRLARIDKRALALPEPIAARA